MACTLDLPIAGLWIVQVEPWGPGSERRYYESVRISQPADLAAKRCRKER